MSTALFGTVGEKRAALIRISGSEAAFAILARVVLFAAFCVVSGRRTRVAFGGIFSCFSLIRDASRSQTGPTVLALGLACWGFVGTRIPSHGKAIMGAWLAGSGRPPWPSSGRLHALPFFALAWARHCVSVHQAADQAIFVGVFGKKRHS